MLIKFIIMEDFLNYKKPSMFVGTPHCTFKCEKECPECKCQNSSLAKEKSFELDNKKIIEMYMSNDITKAIVFGGLEPFDSFDELFEIIEEFRKKTNDDIIIYTGYYKDEIEEKIKKLQQFSNIFVKFGRYRPNGNKTFSNELGVYLASENQYAEKISS